MLFILSQDMRVACDVLAWATETSSYRMGMAVRYSTDPSKPVEGRHGPMRYFQSELDRLPNTRVAWVGDFDLPTFTALYDPSRDFVVIIDSLREPLVETVCAKGPGLRRFRTSDSDRSTDIFSESDIDRIAGYIAKMR